jgi:amino acid transporter
MIISMSEEVKHPATQVPKAMCGALVLNFLCGLLFLVPIVFILPALEDVLLQASPLPYILSVAIGNEGGAFALTIPIIVLGILCGVGCTTASSRCAWAFARDGGIPGSNWWKVVNKKLDVPFNAMMMLMVVEIGLGAIYFGSTAAFNAFSGSGVIFLTLAYVTPIVMSVLEGRRSLKGGHYNFGIFGWICNIIAIGEFGCVFHVRQIANII